GEQVFTVLTDPMVFGLLVGRGVEGGILPERHAGDLTQVGVVRDAPTLRVVGDANTHRDDVQDGLRLIDPTPEFLVEATDLLLGPLAVGNLDEAADEANGFSFR